MIDVGDLDVCNGQADDTFGYRYHTSADAPYIVQCLMGEVAAFDRVPRVRPLNAATGGGAAPGRPPQGGVENLVFTEAADGSRSMDYTYEGDAYFMRYTPADSEGCYLFETRTVTNDGALLSGEYCR